MPVKSKKQWELMQAVAEGKTEVPGLEPEEAKKMLDDTPMGYMALPQELEDGGVKRYKKLRKMLGKCK